MNKIKTLRFFFAFILISAVTIYAAPTRPASAHDSPDPHREGNVTASAVFVPAQVSDLGFILSGRVKEVLVKEGDHVKAGDVLIVQDAPELQFAVAAAEAALRSAQSNAELQRYGRVKERRNGKIFWTQLPKEFIEIADIQVLRAQASLEIAQAMFAQTTLVAPFDGTIAAVDVVSGEFVQSGQVVLTLAALDLLQVETTDLSERDIAKVHIGGAAEIFIEASNENIAGKVIGISPIADVVGGDVVFKVTIKLEEQIKGLRWGMTAEVNISE
jgi:RND family efflux transporter MFP subunit